MQWHQGMIMNKFEPLSCNEYIFLPTQKFPKVAIVVDNRHWAGNSFKLYNPFSIKAKLLKALIRFGFVYFNTIFKIAFKVQRGTQSELLQYIEGILGQQLISSVYFATAKDKVVLQLQTCDAKVLGYLKLPLTDVGVKRIINERTAIEIISSKKLVEPSLLDGNFSGRPFVLLANLDGDIGYVSNEGVSQILSGFFRRESYSLLEHPRIKQILNQLISCELNTYHDSLLAECQGSSCDYALVYEHGDFAPWNVVNVGGKYVPFDFEYFCENGLEHLDLIKYYYQIGTLLKKYENLKLIDFLEKNIDITEFDLLFKVFLVKEVVRCKEENESCEFEVNLLGFLGLV